MARLKNKLLFKGKADGLVYYEYRGLPCVRRMPRNVEPPHAPGQIAQQERIAAVAIFFRALKEVGIYACWQKAAEGTVQTGYNLLVQENLRAFDEKGNVCDFSKLRITPDMLPLPDGVVLEAGETGEWRVTWENAVHHPGAGMDDRLVVAVMEGDAANYEVKLPEVGDFRRRDGEAVFRLPEGFGEYGKMYVFFKNEPSCRSSRCILFNLKLMEL